MSRTDRRSARAEARRYATLSTLGAIGAVTAVGLGSAVPAQAAPAETAPARSPLFTPRALAGPVERTPHLAPVERAPQRSTVLYTVRSGDTVSALAHRYDSSVRAIIEANDLNSRALIRVGQTLRIPTGSPADTSSRDSSSTSRSSSRATTYKVRSGDTVSAIAARYGSTVRAIIEANDLNSRALIRVGQTLRIPGSGSSSSSSSSNGSHSAGGSTASTGSSSSGSSSSSSTSSVDHKVISGDTVSSIAAQYGSTVSAIVEANDLGPNAVIRVGQTLSIPGGVVSNTFLHYTYSGDVTAAANANKRQLLNANLPSRDQMRSIIRQTAQSMGVDPALALAVAHQESGFNPAAVSPANAVGVMQVIPSSGQWASQLVGYELNLLDPQDNVTAGVAILRQLQRMADNQSDAIGGYYQGLGSVQRNGLYSDTRRYVANVQTLMTRYA